MTWFERLFGGTRTVADGQPFELAVGGTRARAVRVPMDADAGAVLAHLQLTTPRAALFITGGAGQMSDEDKALTRQMFEQGIAPIAEEYKLAVIDGGTHSGVIEMMATARLKHRYTFPLIGVAPIGQVKFRGHANAKGHMLSPGHSHFVFVNGSAFGDESEMIIMLAHALAGGHADDPTRPAPALGVVINGGQITRQEAYLASTKELKLPLVVLEGSGRFADELAAAKRTGETSQALLKSIIDRADIMLVGTNQGPQKMRQALTTHLTVGYA